MSWSIGPYDPQDGEKLNEAFNEVFGLNRSLAEWNWKFRPEEDGCRIVVAKDVDGAIVAQYASVVVQVQIYGCDVLAAQPVDVFCVRSGKSVVGRAFIKTVDEFFALYGNTKKLPIFFGFPGDRALRLGRRSLGYKAPVSIECFQKMPRTKLFSFPTHRVKSGWQPHAFDDLWNGAKGRYPVAVVRNQQWLNRRYRSHPRVKYEFLSAWKSSKCECLAVLCLEDRPSVVDVIWDGKDCRAITALDRAIAKICKRRQTGSVSIWLNGDNNLREQLLESGWERVDDPSLPVFVTRSYDPTIDADKILHDFYLTMGDTDLV